MKATNHGGRQAGPRPDLPANVIPFLTASRHRRGSGPVELAVALRRLHAAGMRGGFVLLDAEPADTVRNARSHGASSSHPDLQWWKRLGDRIAEQTRLSVALLGVELDAETPSSANGRPQRRCVVLPGFPRGERSVLLELARAVCSGDLDLLAEARALGVPAFEPDELAVASSDGTLPELLAHPVARTLPASA